MRRAVITAGMALTLLTAAPARAAEPSAEPTVVITIDGIQSSAYFFEERARDTYSDFITIALANAADVPVAGLTTAISGERPGDFEVLADGCDGETLLLAGEGCEILLRYHPLGTGFSDADLTFSYGGGTRTVILFGVAREPAPRFSIDTTSVTFAPLALGYGTGASVEITNTGYGNLTIGAITMSDPAAAHFYVDAANRCRESIVRQGDRCRVGISFVPLDEGRFHGTIEIHHDAPGSPAIVSVDAEGIMVHPTIISEPFPTLLEGETAERVFTIRNTYYRKVNLGTVAIGGNDTDPYTITGDGCSGIELGLDATCSVTILFAPGAPGEPDATLDVPTDAPGGVKQVALTGAAVARIASAEPNQDRVRFGAIGTRRAKRARITVSSDGTIPVRITSVRRFGSSWFTVLADGCSGRTLDPGRACSLTVRFLAKATSSRRAVLAVRTSGGTVTLPLTGRGRPHR